MFLHTTVVFPIQYYNINITQNYDVPLIFIIFYLHYNVYTNE